MTKETDEIKTNKTEATDETKTNKVGATDEIKTNKAEATWILLKPFSVNKVKWERMIREIMVLRNAGKGFNWKGNAFAQNEFNEVLNKATALANKFKFEQSWGHILNAETLMVNSLHPTDYEGLKIRAQMILIESEKINSGWRLKQLKVLLGDDSKPLTKKQKAILRDKLLKAMTIRNDYYLTLNHKINLHTVNANILTLVMFLLLVSILLLSSYWDITNPNTIEGRGFSKGLTMAALFGALGAGFSYGKTLFSYNPELSKIPDQLLSMTVTYFRFIIGATAAIIILSFFKSRFLSDKFSDIIFESPITYFVFAFAAGFSERWVVKMIGLVTKEKEKE